MPHDVEVRELGTGRSRKEVCEDELRLTPIDVAPRLPIYDGIEAVRRILAQCWFDEEACARGLAALTEYTKSYDERQGVFQQRPLHNWASHGSDAFRTLATLHEGRERLRSEAVRDRYRSARPTSWMAS